MPEDTKIEELRKRVDEEIKNFDSRLTALEDYLGSAEQWLTRLDDAMGKFEFLIQTNLDSVDDFR